MDTPQFYRELSDVLFQGDIFERVPIAYVKEPPQTLKKATLAGKRPGYEVVSDASAVPSGGTSALVIAASCDHTRAVLLTHDCEIDKPSAKLLTLALVRPFHPQMPDQDQVTIRENRKFSFFYLPPLEPGVPESYVDFRRLGTVGQDLLKGSRRIGRLSEMGSKAMFFQAFRFLTRIDLDKANLQPAREDNP